MESQPALPLSIQGPKTRHPLADACRPLPVSVIILIGLLAALGWSPEQIVEVLAVLLPASAVWEGRR